MKSVKYSKLFMGFLFCFIQSCNSQVSKINGVSFVASPSSITETHVNPLVEIQANHAAIMPFGFMTSLKTPNVIFNTDRQWFGETCAGVKQYAQTLKAKGLKIMIKPQLWVMGGEFTGYIKMNTEKDWTAFETDYLKFILEYAKLAQTIDAELFCIGTELEQFIINRPEYWTQLITEIKLIYKGKLTYAANWDEFKRTPFWSELDYIGIDAYFPVSNSKTPSVTECLKAWTLHKSVIKTHVETYNKSILFTEYGYRSVDFSGKEPWKFDNTMNVVNLEAQYNTTKALFETFWGEEWFAGGFIWKWFHNHKSSGGLDNSQFTPQNKPVEQLIKYQYAAY